MAIPKSRVPKNIDDYIDAAPLEVQSILREIRTTIRAAAPDAREVMSYRMPALKQHGILIYFAAFNAHIGIFPPISGDNDMKEAIAPYAGPKGNLKFPLDQPIPYELLKRFVALRVEQDASQAATKAKAKAKKR